MEAPTQDQQWAHSGENFEMMAGVADGTDFANFLDVDFDQEFPLFNQATNGPGQAQGTDNLQQVLDPQLVQQHLQRHPHLARSTTDHVSPNFAVAETDHNGNAVYAHALHDQFNQQQQQQGSQKQVFVPNDIQFHPHNAVPPTPNSMKMHSDPHQYLQQMDPQMRAALEQQFQLRSEGMMNFTPLVSPAVTPHDAQFQVNQDFTTVPGAYFSPLTSPALEGQSGQGTPHFRPSGPQSASSATTSPIDIDVDMLGDPAVPQPTSAPKRTTRKRPTTAASAASRIRQSPLARARDSKRKPALSQPQPKEIQALQDEALRMNAPLPQKSGPLSVPGGSSDGGSVSPEPLSESVMGPPPKPGSALQSPLISAQMDQARAVAGLSPATPASIMRISGKAGAARAAHMSPTSAAQHALRRSPHSLEDLTLPEAAVGSPATSAPTPLASAQVTPKLGPLSTSAAPTPLVSPLTPGGLGTAAGSKRGSTSDSKSGRGKKRNSTSISDGRPPAPNNSTEFRSPALRPKVSISPSINPQLKPSPAVNGKTPTIAPQTPITINENTAHLLLASKSNYQHLVDGTNVHVPGLEYPESLSTGLTSKRTSHKIAEQGRRNRINIALQEMGRLIPPQYRGAKSPTISAQSPDAATSPVSGAAAQKTNGAMAPSPSGANSNSGNSKAATVENAIVYIRDLQKSATEQDAAMKAKDAEIEALRRRLGMASTSSPEQDPDADHADDEAEHDGLEKAHISTSEDGDRERRQEANADSEKEEDIIADRRMDDG